MKTDALLTAAEVREILARHGESVEGKSDDDFDEIARRVYGMARVVIEAVKRSPAPPAA